MWIFESALRISAVLAAAGLVISLSHRRSAAFRHGVLTSALAVSVLMPGLGTLAPAWEWPSLTEAVAPTPAVSSDVAMTMDSGEVPAGIDLETIALAVWAFGAMSIAMSLLFGCVRLWRIYRRSAPLDEAGWSRPLREIARAYGIRSRVGLFESEGSHLMTWGILRPRIVVPRGARNWSEARARAVLGHELAHIRRGDWALQWLAEALRVIYWFDPLVWIACRHLRSEAERASDDLVIGDQDGADYAGHVVDLARDLRAPHLPAVAFAQRTGGDLERRVEAMLDGKRDRRPVSRSGGILVGMVFLALGLAAAGCGASRSATLQATGPDTATLFGTVVDGTGALVPGVEITVTPEPESGTAVVRISDRTGSFRVGNLTPGAYMATAELPGFIRTQYTGLTLTAGEERELSFLLQVSGGSSDVRVQAARTGEEAAEPEVAAPPQLVEPLRIGGNVTAGQLVRRVEPGYPEDLRQEGVEGVVVLEATIGTDGTIEELRTITGPAGLREAAEEAVRQWRYRPYLLNGNPVATTTTITVEFSLQDQE